MFTHLDRGFVCWWCFGCWSHGFGLSTIERYDIERLIALWNSRCDTAWDARGDCVGSARCTVISDPEVGERQGGGEEGEDG